MIDMDDAALTVRDLAEFFETNINDINTRLWKLKRWGMVRVVNQRRPRGYAVTDWGKKFLSDLEERKREQLKS